MICSVARLADYEDEWDRLNTEGPNTPLLDVAFFKPMLEISDNIPMSLAVAKQSGEIVAMGILHQTKIRLTWQTFQPSQAPLGIWIANQEIPIPHLLRGLQENLPGFCLILGITQQDPDQVTRFNDYPDLLTFDHIKTAKITVNKAFEDYWEQRSPNLKNNLRRQRNRLLREGVMTRLRVITDPENVKVAIDHYGLLESQGWKAKQGTALHPNNFQGKLYRSLLQYFCGRGEGIVYQYWYDDKLVATDVYLRRNRVLYLLKTTYDETQKTTSPTMLMREEIFKEIFEKKLYGTIEFFGRLMDWHTKWTKEVRTMFHINKFRWPILANLHGFNRK